MCQKLFGGPGIKGYVVKLKISKTNENPMD